MANGVRALRVIDVTRLTLRPAAPGVEVLYTGSGQPLLAVPAGQPMWRATAAARRARTLTHQDHRDLIVWYQPATDTALIGEDPPYQVSGVLDDGEHAPADTVALSTDGSRRIGSATLAPFRS